MTDYKNITLKSRRRHPRFECLYQVYVTSKGLFRKRYSVKLINPSESGFQLVSDHYLNEGKKYRLQFVDSGESFDISLLWSNRNGAPNTFVSGCKLLNQSLHELERFQDRK